MYKVGSKNHNKLRAFVGADLQSLPRLPTSPRHGRRQQQLLALVAERHIAAGRDLQGRVVVRGRHGEATSCRASQF